MNLNVTFKNIQDTAHEGLRKLVSEFAQGQLAKRLGALRDEAVRLHAVIERHPTDGMHRVALRLRLPHQILVSREDNLDVRLALKEAFGELERQVERYVSRLKRRDQWKRPARRERLRRLKAAVQVQPQEERQLYLDLVQQELDALRRFVRHEITYLRATGDLRPDYPGVDDVIDEVLARGWQRFHEHRDHLSVRSWLFGIALAYLEEEVARYHAEEGLVPLEERVSPPAGTLIDDEMMDFWQPDEELHIEDLVEAPDTLTPEEAAEKQETLELAYRLLSLMPHTWRRALTLNRIQSLGIDEIAELMRTEPAQVEQWVGYASAFIEARCRELGRELTSVQAVLELFGVPKKAKESEELAGELGEAVGPGAAA
ncbi:MAG TPA: hypothetical protein ENK12_12100 [Gammaproteobacteria bacterium]|nr:hypothetical protein [Gammaproteobacteria bacterium]